MAKYHVNDKGEAGKCSAVKGKCPFGSENDHHASPERAREAYEQKMGGAGLSTAAAVYKQEAVEAYERLNNILALAEHDEGPAHIRHQEIASAHEDMMVAAESYRLRVKDEDERNAWNRTAALAHLRQLEHERAAHLLTPRDLRGERHLRKATLAALEAKVTSASEAFEDISEDYRDSPAAAGEMAGDLHREWQKARNYEERLKDDGNGGQIDIANTDFVNLPYKWQEENLKASQSALNRTAEHYGNIELAAADIHNDWLDRNREWAEAGQLKKFSQLSEDEKEKDRVLARNAYKKLTGQ